MTLNSFRLICLDFGITLDEGYALYAMYKSGSIGAPNVKVDSLLKFLEKGLYANGELGDKVKETFKKVEMEFREGELHNDTLENHKRAVQNSAPVQRRDMACMPLLDSIIEGMRTLLMPKEITKGKVFKALEEKVLMYFNGDQDMADFYLLWYHLWPTTGSKNAAWDSFFGVPYTGVTLRISSEGSIRDFKHDARKYDLRIYILATYLFIKNGVNPREEKCYIQKIANFLPTREQWYLTALDVIEELGGNLPLIFDKYFLEKYSHTNSGNSAGTLI